MACALGTALPVAALFRHRIGGLLGRPRREHVLRQVPHGGVCAEIGVFRGRFTEHILAIAKPSRLHLIDGWWTFHGEHFPDWGAYTEHGQLATRDAFEEVQGIIGAADPSIHIQVHVDDDLAILASFPDRYFDWVYLDSSHEYEHSCRELTALEPKMKPSGLVLGDDWHDDLNHIHGGVAQAVREFCSSDRWELAIPGDQCGQWMIQRAPRTLPRVMGSCELGVRKQHARTTVLGWRRMRSWSGPLEKWIIEARLGQHGTGSA